jgi:hypothetical protein
MMAGYFRGVRDVHRFTMDWEGGKGLIECAVSEQWTDIDTGTTVRCGETGSCTVTATVGLSEQYSNTLESSIEGSLGVTGIAQLKTNIKTATGTVVNWSRGATRSQTFNLTAPKCGRNSLSVYQLERIYDLTYRRSSAPWFRSEPRIWHLKWARRIVEGTSNYDALPDREQVDDICGCKDALEERWRGIASISSSPVSFRVPYKYDFARRLVLNLPNGMKTIDLQADDVVGTDLKEGLLLSLPLAAIPEPLVFLAGLKAPFVDVSVVEEELAEESLFDPPVETGEIVDVFAAGLAVGEFLVDEAAAEAPRLAKADDDDDEQGQTAPSY